MSELDDYPIEAEEGWEQERRPPWRIIAAVLVALLLGAAGLFFYLRGRDAGEEEVAVAAATPEAADEEAGAEPAEVDLPPLEESDAWMREVLRQLSAHPQLAAWLTPDDLVRRFVALVDNIAHGSSPRAHVPFVAPSEAFAVNEAGGRTTIDPASYRRYDLLVDVVDSLHVSGTVGLYRAVEPLLDEAYRELGYPDGDFGATLDRAIDEILAVPVPPAPLRVEADIDGFRFADPELESLDPAQKHVLRMGPENLTRVQAKLRALQGALRKPAAPAPGSVWPGQTD